ncbi:MAG TPA: hypothetical protein VJN70_00990 [Gemmatimonadaceae bacterium]|nr:hypothetical protein [Gemmatimonadaceae bacterium]
MCNSVGDDYRMGRRLGTVKGRAPRHILAVGRAHDDRGQGRQGRPVPLDRPARARPREEIRAKAEAQ